MQITKEVVSVSEMARMLGFSRARFYQLMKDGTIPKPIRPENGGRPFFDRGQQEKCLTVRRTNCGIDGRPILFYSMRSPSSAPPPAPRRQSPRRSAPERPRRAEEDATINELRHGLAQLGVAQVTEQSIRTVLAEVYPDGWSRVDHAELLRSVFNRLNCQDSQDNVAR